MIELLPVRLEVIEYRLHAGLSSHLEGVQNGMFLAIVGLVWPRLVLGEGLAVTTFWLAIYGTFANWLATLLAAVWGAGAPMMPIAAHSFQGTPAQETVITALLASLALAMILVCCFILWGLRVSPSHPEPGSSV